MGLLTHRTRTGEVRRWTVKEIVQGKPLNRPTHPMLIHFPIAFYIGALAADVLSRVGTFPAAVPAATYALLGAFAVTIAAATTGLVDRSTMRSGSKARKTANIHMWLQFTVLGIFVVDFLVRWSGRHHLRASWGWVGLEAIGTLVLLAAADFGGQLVYLIGFRVGSSDE
jgi:uncharacterized membrane protein